MAENTYRKRENSPKSSGSSRAPKASNSETKWKLALGFVSVLTALFLFVSFVSYFFTGKKDQSVVDALFSTPIAEAGLEVSNWFGIAGAVAAQFFIFRWFGISAFLIIPILLHIGYFLIYHKVLFKLTRYILFTVFTGLWLGSVMGYITYLIEHETIWGYYCGGIGYELAILQHGIMGWGSILFFIFLLIIFIVFFYDVTSIPAMENIKEKVENFSSLFRIPFLKKSQSPNIQSDDSEEELAIQTALKKIKGENTLEEDEAVEEELKKWTVKTVPNLTVNEQKEKKKLILDIENTSLANEEFTIKLPPSVKKEEPQSNLDNDNVVPFKLPPVIARTKVPSNDSDEIDFEINEIEEESTSEDFVMENYDPTLDLPRYKYPTADLLFDYPPKEAKVTKEELEANKDKIVETLINFKIGIASIKATIGPTVTLYEIVPDAGIKISKIKNLEDDIALSLSALGIRIIAPIPGKGTIGIEVPNKNKEMVDIKSVITTEKFMKSDKDLPIVLGKTISNEVYVTDLAKMPHLLIAGATGQGKSVGLNVVLTSLIYKKHPSQLKFVLVDPKKVELTLFNKLERHFLAMLPNSDEAIITDTSKVINTLNSLCIEMDSRYDLLKDAGCRNLKEYNTKFINRRLNPKKGHKYLPYIVLVIDELADLMITAGKEVETPIARLAQLARAIGIHLIVATQRPSVNVITGIIKANFPARLSFRVTSKIDSRTILDTGGADQLIGQGDMLLSMGSEIIRLQCAFVDTPEVDAICDFIGEQQGYDTAYLLPEFEGGEDSDYKEVDLSERDSLFDEAARLIVRHQQGSTSLIQRKMKLGYNRAGRIIDQLEAAGIVGAFEGSKAREVLIQDEHTLEQLLSGLDK